MPPPARSSIAVAPNDGRADWLADAVRAGGGTVTDPDEASGLIWTTPRHPEQLEALLVAHQQISWVQLPFAGIEAFIHLTDERRTWTCGKGVYAEPVAELALALLLAGMRGVGHYARRTRWDTADADTLGHNLVDAHITILGGGGITRSLLRLLDGFTPHTTVVRRDPTASPLDAGDVVGFDALDSALTGADAVVLALALTPETHGVLNARTLELLPDHAWVVNVARGPHVVTDDLVAALATDTIGGAGLDVTDPEPLPDGHPLWAMDNVIITPHVGNTPAMARPLLSARVTDNVGRWIASRPLVGPVDPRLGY